MKLFKKGGQKYQNILGKVTGEYEIKTFKGNQRIRSPIGPPFLPMRRSPNIKKFPKFRFKFRGNVLC